MGAAERIMFSGTLYALIPMWQARNRDLSAMRLTRITRSLLGLFGFPIQTKTCTRVMGSSRAKARTAHGEPGWDRPRKSWPAPSTPRLHSNLTAQSRVADGRVPPTTGADRQPGAPAGQRVRDARIHSG